MVPILALSLLMDDILTDSSASDEEGGYLSENYDQYDHYDPMSDVSGESVDDQDEDPDYSPTVPMDDTENTEPQPSPESIQSSAAAASDNEQAEEPPNEAAKPVEVKEQTITASQRSSGDDDGQICTICFEPWTNSSVHRLVSLRCGHLFGRSCITRWLKGQNARCPQCNARARKSEIRNIYAKAVKVLDSSERDKALQDLAKETELRRAAEMSAAQERVKHMLAVQECERLKKELIQAKNQLSEYRSALSSKKSLIGSESAKSNLPLFSLVGNIDIAKDGGCRLVDSCDLLGMLLVSQPSSNPLFPGYGFRKISTHEMKASEFVLVHQKPIKDMAFHAYDGLVLTASLDKSLKITNVLSNSVAHTYNVGFDVWSCAWDAENPVYFYGGLKTGEVYVFDIRVTDRHVHHLPQFGSRTPVVSLEYFQAASSCNSRNSGPVVGKLSDCAFHKKTETKGEYKIVPMPALGPYTCVSADSSGHFLISCRPSQHQPRVTHTICNFVEGQYGELTCCPVKTLIGGRTQPQLTRSKLLPHPDKASSLLVCAGDEDARGVLVWDGSSGDCLDNLRTDSPVLDLSGMKVDHKSLLATLTDKSLRLYKWNGL